MKYLVLTCTLFVFISCGTNFFLNKEPIDQRIVLSQGDRFIELSAKTIIENNVLRTQLVSDFYRGEAEIVYENGEYHMTYRNLPLDKKKMALLKEDLYAAFFAGDYPYKSDEKMFGEVKQRNGSKLVKDKDGYEIYRVTYNGQEVQLVNLIRQYTISIFSEISF